jgi:pyridoxine/pyridoxamine 5'-phosphate oxidase
MWGFCEAVTDLHMKEKLWRSLPREWQSGWYGTQQGRPLQNGQKDSMKRIAKQIEEKYKDKDIPICSDFELYRIIPEGVEFYQSGSSLLDHDRILYTRDKSSHFWKKDRLMP